MAWITLIFAGLFEVVGVMGMNLVTKQPKIKSYIILIGGFAASFGLLRIALHTLPIGLAYAVWTGIGTVGATLAGMFLYGEQKDWKRISFIMIVLIAIIGLKLTP